MKSRLADAGRVNVPLGAAGGALLERRGDSGLRQSHPGVVLERALVGLEGKVELLSAFQCHTQHEEEFGAGLDAESLREVSLGLGVFFQVPEHLPWPNRAGGELGKRRNASAKAGSASASCPSNR